jgi:hypothetical protein
LGTNRKANNKNEGDMHMFWQMAGRRAVLATILIGLGAAVLVGLVRLGEGRLQAAPTHTETADQEAKPAVAAVPLGSDSSGDEPTQPSETVQRDPRQQKPGGAESSSASATDDTTSSATVDATALRNRPRTEADHVVAAARARSLGLDKLPRFQLRGTYWNAPVVDMQKLPERSLENLWKMRARQVDTSKRYGSKTAIAWEGARLVLRTDRAFLDDTGSPPYTSCRYWDGTEGWWGNLSDDSRTIGRYRSIGELMKGPGWIYFPNFRALSNRLAWPGEVLAFEHEPVHPSLARYERVGDETIDGQPCDVFDGPARYERVWIEKSTGRLKAVYRRSLHRVHPDYYSDLVREVAGRTFEGGPSYAAWLKQQPKEL